VYAEEREKKKECLSVFFRCRLSIDVKRKTTDKEEEEEEEKNLFFHLSLSLNFCFRRVFIIERMIDIIIINRRRQN
jgi:hypothetical protein